MKLRLVRHLWGVDISRGLSPYIAPWRENGYELLEVSLRRLPDPAIFLKILQNEGFAWIPQVFSNMFAGGGSVQQHLLSLREQVEECLDASPLFINAHSGSDAWTTAEAEDFYGLVTEMEGELGVNISHETHRSRYFGNPWNTKHILDRFPHLQLTCDFSHWVCVAERLLQDCTEILNQVADHCLHIHARVGYEEGPQVPDPRAPEWAEHLRVHETWWEMVWSAQRKRSFQTSTLTPEFGPPLYMQIMPYTQKPLANLTEICDWMALRQANRFRAMNA
ncbi:MAG TPA: sugar phosphate isomerase/epimerase [Candidatus Angelobacter sp.]|jgi:hypothetical protein